MKINYKSIIGLVVITIAAYLLSMLPTTDSATDGSFSASVVDVATDALDLRSQPSELDPAPAIKPVTYDDKTDEMVDPIEEMAKFKQELNDSLWMGWAFYESGDKDVWTVRGDGGHAYGRYQFDDRHLLADFFRYCVENDRERYEAFTTFYYVDSNGKVHLQNSDEIEANWKWMDYVEDENFHDIQTRFAVERVYQPAYETLKKYCADLDSYGPVLRGTIMSIAIRDGYYASDLRAITETYYSGIPEEEWLQAIYDTETYIHSDDDYKRWAYSQKDSALEALKMYNECMTKERTSSNLYATVKKYDFEPVTSR